MNCDALAQFIFRALNSVLNALFAVEAGTPVSRRRLY